MRNKIMIGDKCELCAEELAEFICHNCGDELCCDCSAHHHYNRFCVVD